MIATARGKRSGSNRISGGRKPAGLRAVSQAASRPSSRSWNQSRESRQSIPCAADVELTVQRWESIRAQAKELYEEADHLEQQIITALSVGGSLVLSDNRTVRVVDNFRDAAGNP